MNIILKSICLTLIISNGIYNKSAFIKNIFNNNF